MGVPGRSDVERIRFQPQKGEFMAKTILIVDDEETNRELFQYMLVTRHYRTLEAASGTQALSILEEESPDLILLDLFMEGGDGLMVTQAVRNDPRIQDIPIVVVTAADSPDIHRKVQDAGCDSVILKPVDMNNFLDTIDQFFTEDKG
jgi:CheY-like chemotaxis protein